MRTLSSSSEGRVLGVVTVSRQQQTLCNKTAADKNFIHPPYLARPHPSTSSDPLLRLTFLVSISVQRVLRFLLLHVSPGGLLGSPHNKWTRRLQSAILKSNIASWRMRPHGV